MRAETAAVLVCALLGAGPYLNTIPANFAFDDNFAVIYNGDVTNDANTLAGMLTHDFWGQRIASEQSHKSYRPLTVLSFRLTRKAWAALPRAWREAVIAWRSASLLPNEENEAARRGLDPLLFHAANVAAHAAASGLVAGLAYFLLRRRWSPRPLLRVQGGGGEAGGGGTGLQQARGSPGPGRGHSSGGGGNGLARGPGATTPASARPSQPGLRKRSTAAVTPQPPAPSPDATPPASAASHMFPPDPPALHAAAWFAGAAFALHPVHTEAVAGVVGHAELLCALLSVPAVRLYVSAAEAAAVRRAAPVVAPGAGGAGGRGDRGRGSGEERARGKGDAWSWGAKAAHWGAVLGAASLAVLAALAKEIGITVLGCMLAADVMLVPVVVRQPHAAHGSTAGRGGAVLRVLRWAAWEEPKLPRMALLAAVGVAYVKLRSWVAVDQLVRIYRKVENPIPFAPAALVRVLSTGHLHARYAGLLLWPRHLSADWSYNCVPLVTAVTDPRNGLTVALYGYLIWLAVAAKPWGVLRTWWRAAALVAAGVEGSTPREAHGSADEDGGTADPVAGARTKEGPGSGGGQGQGEEEGEGYAALWAARWRLLVAAGLLVGPFFPASNVLFYVGTFIGERLLYFPSVGFCLLAAEGLGGALARAEGQRPQPRTAPAGDAVGTITGARSGAAGARAAAGDGKGAAASAAEKSGGAAGVRRAVRMAVYGFMAVVLMSYALRTWSRNWDWRSEAALFTSAEQVCGASAKVQLNMGILRRRQGDMRGALEAFRRARAIEPGYCEPGYWIGLTHVNSGAPHPGITELEAALSCKYVAAEALKALNTIFKTLHDADPRDPVPIMRWGLVLVRPELGRAGEGCDSLEQAALGYARMGATQEAEEAVGRCAEAIQRGALDPGGPGAGPSAAAAEVASEVFGVTTAEARHIGPPPAQLLRCLAARLPVYRALGQAARAAASGAAQPTAAASAALASPKGPMALPSMQAAVYEYIRQVSEREPLCRRAAVSMADPDPRAQAATSPPHMHLLHLLQSLDPVDPWLQAEWGRLMRELGRAQEAVMHLSVSAVLLSQQLGLMQEGGQPTARSLRSPSPSSPSPSSTRAALNVGASLPPVSAVEALEGVAVALEEAARLRPPNACEMWRQAVEARRMLVARAVGAGDAEGYGRHSGALAGSVGEVQAGAPQCREALAAAMGLGNAKGGVAEAN
ncbi:hypothetical protein HYH03_000324 [Edaphochlamys debaryana]|uniref:dolichyl-phosphate-mannose--protein mannosyltransferase n=1 Tax=Edaphochlamys debaryana TaxID=47281 RepID=A0A835YFE7_9CHLO|nr:hypothetical protein HYH03_000324 [Edaphochlamys debaryana]|eukprot:KAG2501825.1 hypothetical protein HYH03_000324 [Edaphochlamys debaryana]